MPELEGRPVRGTQQEEEARPEQAAQHRLPGQQELMEPRPRSAGQGAAAEDHLLQPTRPEQRAATAAHQRVEQVAAGPDPAQAMGPTAALAVMAE
jgi:hypothetical protein